MTVKELLQKLQDISLQNEDFPDYDIVWKDCNEYYQDGNTGEIVYYFVDIHAIDVDVNNKVVTLEF